MATRLEEIAAWASNNGFGRRCVVGDMQHNAKKIREAMKILAEASDTLKDAERSYIKFLAELYDEKVDHRLAMARSVNEIHYAYEAPILQVLHGWATDYDYAQTKHLLENRRLLDE